MVTEAPCRSEPCKVSSDTHRGLPVFIMPVFSGPHIAFFVPWSVEGLGQLDLRARKAAAKGRRIEGCVCPSFHV